MLAERAFGQLASVWSKMRVLSRWVAVNQSGGQSGPMSDPPPWHFTTWLDLLDHWQTLFAGVLAVLAAWRTIRATTKSADREVAASQAQTAVAQKQIETTIDLARRRDENEYDAFRIMLEAAMARVIDEVPLARTAVSVDTPNGRACITKGGFDELRGVCVTLGSPLTGEFLDLEREIDNFALGLWDRDLGLRKLNSIEVKATELRDKAAQDQYGIVWPGRAERAGV
jgi:hypothetical protein